MTKCYALQKDVFDINKVTVVGSPTITDDGVASGFAYDSDYLKIPQTINIENGIEIYLAINLSTLNKIQCLIYDRPDNRFTISVTSNNTVKFSIWATTTNAFRGVESQNTLSLNKWYYIKVKYDKTRLYIYISTDGINYVLDNSLVFNDTPIKTVYNGLNLCNAWYTDVMFNGSIDLKQFKIYVDNELVYSPTKPTYYLERRKEGFDLSKFTVVGSPTITNDGVASGFSSVNYIGTFNSNLLSKPFELYFCFTATNVTIRQTLLGMNLAYGFNIGMENSKMMFGASSNGTYLDIAHNVLSTLTINTNTQYIGRLKWTGTVYTLSLLIDNIWIDYITVNSSSAIISNNTINIGTISGVHPYINGSIDLKQFSITVDGEEVFTGAKEKYYAMKKG